MLIASVDTRQAFSAIGTIGITWVNKRAIHASLLREGTMLRRIVVAALALSTMACAYRKDDRPFEVCPSDWTTEQLVAIESGFQLWEEKGVRFELELTCDHHGRGIYARPAYEGHPASYEEMTGHVSLDTANKHTGNLVELPTIVAHEIAHSRTGEHNPEPGNLMSAVLSPFPFVATESDARWLAAE